MNESWFQLLTVILANFSVVWWFRKESRDDWKMIDKEMKEFRENSRSEMKEFREIVRFEMKDFHERLLEIEKSRIK